MKRTVITTSDGSKTIQIEDWNEQYHSIHGAVQEAQHVFVKTGLHHFSNLHKPINLNILEIGFGTGLNAFLTVLESEKKGVKIRYEGVEAYPVLAEELSQLNYPSIIGSEQQTLFDTLHEISWGKLHSITSHFSLKKRQQFFSDIVDKNRFDLIYFDAFGARVQPFGFEKCVSTRVLNSKRRGRSSPQNEVILNRRTEFTKVKYPTEIQTIFPNSAQIPARS